MRHFYVNFSASGLSGFIIHSSARHILHKEELTAFQDKVCSLVAKQTGNLIRPESVSVAGVIEIDEETASSYKPKPIIT